MKLDHSFVEQTDILEESLHGALMKRKVDSRGMKEL